MSAPHPDGEALRDPRLAFAELSKIMLSEQPLAETLRCVADLAKQVLPGAAEVSVTLLQNGRPISVVFTGPLASELDERQYDAGFGPCMDAAASGGTVTIEDTSEDATYPDFARLARRHGITNTMSVGLPVQRRTIGAINVYGDGTQPFDEPARDLAAGFASYAAVALANAGVYASTATLAANLQRALDSRGVIDQAKGILMGRHGISAETAFDRMAGESQRTNRKVRDIAQGLVDETQRGGPGEG